MKVVIRNAATDGAELEELRNLECGKNNEGVYALTVNNVYYFMSPEEGKEEFDRIVSAYQTGQTVYRLDHLCSIESTKILAYDRMNKPILAN